MTLSVSLDAGQLESLAAGFGGTLILPSDDGYETARKIHNGLIDRRPALIAQCSGTADIAAAVRFARQTGLASPSAGAATTLPGGPFPRTAS